MGILAYMKIALVQKCPSNVDPYQQFKLENVDIYNLSSTKVSRLLKRDIDLNIVSRAEYDDASLDTLFCHEIYDYVILVGTEAVRTFSKVTAVTDYTGKIVPPKSEYEGKTIFIASISPAALAFKPENRPVFDETVVNIHRILNGKEVLPKEGEYEFYRETGEILEYLNFVLDNSQYDVVSLDTETSALAPRDGFLLGVSMSHKLNVGVYMDADAFDLECINTLQHIIDRRRMVLHNAKFDMHFLGYHFNLKFRGRDIHDTMIMHYLLDERQGKGIHGLKSLTMKYGTLGDYERELEEFKDSYCRSHGIKKADFTYDLIPWDIIKVYAAKDTDATLALYYKFYPIIKKNEKLYSCYINLMLPAMHFLTRVEDRGVPVSSKRLAAAKETLIEELIELKDALYKYEEVHSLEKDQGGIFNPNSVQQLRRLLFDYIGLAPTRKLTSTGALSTDVGVLEELEGKHPIPKLILDIRKKSKLKSTYIDKLIPVIDLDKKVRTGFNLTSTTSGRLSSSGKFNMQQLPRGNPIIKGCVVAPKGYKIVACDLATAEIYYAAVLSGDPNMQQVFINMRKDPKRYPDFHSSIAHMVFSLPCEPSEVKKLYPGLRQAAKAISFGILFGSGPKTVAESVNKAFLEIGEPPTCSTEDAKEYIETYFSSFKKLKWWISKCHTEIKKNGFIYNHFGRKRRLHNITSADPGVVKGELRSGFNAIIQSVSSDHLLLGAIDTDNELIEKELDVEIFALVHDSVVALVREDLVEQYLEILYRNIQKDRGCSIPGCPIGIDQDSEEGGSYDYSCGKLAEKFPEIAAIKD